MKVYCSPNTDDIESHIILNFDLNRKILHIVPTMILLRRRLKFFLSKLNLYFNPQKINNIDEKIEDKIRRYHGIYEMDELIKQLVYQNPSEVLSKSEGSVILERIIKVTMQSNQLSWLSVSSDLISFFFELHLTGITLDDLRLLDSGLKWQQVINLYASYLSELSQTNKLDFGQAALQSVSNIDISMYDELILDGAFLPLTAKHHMLIQKFQQQNKPITFLLPYDLAQEDQPAQKAIETIYTFYVPKKDWQSIQQLKPQSYFINRLQKQIFQLYEPTHLDSSFELLRFTTMENEISYIIQKINVLIRRKGVDPKKIVIVTPNAMKLRPLVREISEQYGLKVDLPRRPFMHLLQGKAIKYLYDIHVDLRIRDKNFLNITMFKTFLQESILIVPSTLLSTFEKLESFFLDCTSFIEWTCAIEKVIFAKQQLNPSKYSQHPLNHVEMGSLLSIQQVILDIMDISDQIINVPLKTVKEHVIKLFFILQNDKRFISLEKEVIERLNLIGTALNVQERLLLSSLEFGERISALFTEQEEFEPGEVAATDEDIEDIQRGILVTGPNNVEFQRYQYVFVCRFTQDVYPEPKIYDWLHTKDTELKILSKTTSIAFVNTKELEHFYLDRSLYHVYLSLCATDTQLTISYSQIDNGVELSPAHYIHDIAKVFGIEEGDRLLDKSLPKIERLLETSNVLKSPERIEPVVAIDDLFIEPLRLITDTVFSVEDITVYHYCSRRFYYQKKYPIENIYRDVFHLQAFASSCLYEKSVEHLVAAFPTPMQENDQKKQQKLLHSKIIEFLIAAEESIREIFPVSTRIWHNITSQAEFFLKGLINNIFDNGFVKEYRKNSNGNLTIQLFLSKNPKIIKIDDFTFIANKELEVQYNNGRTHRYSISNLKDFLYFKSNDYEEKDRMEEIKDFYFTFMRQFYSNDSDVIPLLEEITEKIKHGIFPKITGGHCKFCTFNKHCHEREVD